MSTTIQQPEARDLSPEEQQERAVFARDIENRFMDSIQAGRQALSELAKAAYEFDQASGWTALGYETQADWLAQPEIGMTRTQFFRLVRRYRELVIYRELPMETLQGLDASKVDIVLPAIQDNRVQLREALDDVSSLGARDLRDKYVGTRAPSNGDDPVLDPDGEVIEGVAQVIDDEPVAAVGTSDADANEQKFLHAAAVVDSWLEMGGEKRKAKRNWERFVEVHPVFGAMRTLDVMFEGGEVPKDDAKVAWRALCADLGLTFG